MINILKTFEKKDCVHYEIKKVKQCCGRSTKPAGFCTIMDPDGYRRNKICSTKMSYCQYQSREEE